jgi:hypothetical protein
LAPAENEVKTSTRLRAERTGKAVDSGSQQVDEAVKGVTNWFKKK